MARPVESGRRRQETKALGAASTKAATVMGVLGLAAASIAITCFCVAVSSSPAELQGNAAGYFLALSSVLYAGLALVSAAVWVLTTDPRRRTAAGGARRKLLYASLVPFAAAVGLSVATLVW